MQYGYFDDQAKEYVITPSNFIKPERKKFRDDDAYEKAENEMYSSSDSGAFSWLKVGNPTL